MKPDAHKRKKNAIYKKKHGIVTATGTSTKPSDSKKGDSKQGPNQKAAGPPVVALAVASKLEDKNRPEKVGYRLTAVLLNSSL